MVLSSEFLANFFSKSLTISKRDLLRFLTSTKFLSSANSWKERCGKRGSRRMEIMSSSVMELEITVCFFIVHGVVSYLSQSTAMLACKTTWSDLTGLLSSSLDKFVMGMLLRM